MPLMPLFPLEAGLLPGTPLGLHVFEPRYVQLLEDVASVDGRFGVVMITRGSEVGGADERADVGTVAEILARQPVGDDQWMVEAVGVERFRVIAWLEDDPYPRAEIEPWTQLMDDSADAGVRLARQRFDTFLSVVSELGVDVEGVEIPESGLDALYRMAVVAPVSTQDRYRMLAAVDGGAAAEILVDALDGVVEVLRFRLQNG